MRDRFDPRVHLQVVSETRMFCSYDCSHCTYHWAIPEIFDLCAEVVELTLYTCLHSVFISSYFSQKFFFSFHFMGLFELKGLMLTADFGVPVRLSISEPLKIGLLCFEHDC